MSSILIKNATLVNEEKIFISDVLLKDGIIEKIASALSSPSSKIIDAEGKYLLPGVIDDQVHFREPGLTHKGDIYTESKAAVAGGITSFMEMPNTFPPATTQELLQQKYQLAAQKSLANYSFFMGASNDNMNEVLKTNPQNVCGVKVFMGSSTGNMLVDNEKTLENIFSQSPLLVATHCEDEATIRKNMELYKILYGENLTAKHHPLIRDAEACYKSSSLAVELAKKHNARLHVIHLSTAKELQLFTNKIPLEKKRITSEVCIHHLWFDDNDYEQLGNLIKCNPAIKTQQDREALFNAVLDDTIDVIATDHAPHTLEEKQNSYPKAPSGIPLVQHALVAMLEFYHHRKISLEQIVKKMSHDVALCFQIEKRGFIREGYFADLVLVDLQDAWKVNKDNLLSKCNWSPFEEQTFHSKISHTFVNGHLVFENGTFNESLKGQRLSFERQASANE